MNKLSTLAATLSLTACLAVPLTAQAHKHHDMPAAATDTHGCDMSGMDMSKMSAAEHQKMMADCQSKTSGTAAAKPNCDMSGMDMSKMSAAEHQKMMADCQTPPTQPAAAPKGGS